MIAKFMKIDFITTFFAVLWLVGWILNALKHMGFNLNELVQFYISVIVPKIGIHGINSIYNSPKGEPPK
jgi:hypothetical protein